MMFALMRAMKSPIPHELQFLRSIEYKSEEEIREIQSQRLDTLLRHAWENTEYYNKVLSDCGVVNNGSVHLDRFNDIPFLTKEIIRREGDRLKAKNLPVNRKSYQNRTGGSTGETVVFWQDNYYWNLNVATKLYHFAMHGKEIGELELKLWGSNRDIVHDTIGWTTKLKNFLYHRHVSSCGRLSEEDMRSIYHKINKCKPKSIWGYTDGVYTLAKFINRYGLKLHPPAVVFGGGGTLFPHMVQAIEKAFQAPMINMYGSREMGDIACQCPEKEGLHVSSHTHVVEIVDRMGNAVMEKGGDIAVTSLHNYAMPFLRYRIGDRGKLTAKKCSCGRSFPLLETVLGRSMESFITKEGDIVSPIYMITMLSTILDTRLIRKFQLIQDGYTCVTIKVVLNSHVSREQSRLNLDQASSTLKSIMGHECTITYDFVDEIPTTQSGKYLYTVCNLPK